MERNDMGTGGTTGAGAANTPSFDTGTTGFSGGASTSSQGTGSSQSAGSSGGAREQVEQKVDQARTKAADGLEGAAQRLDDMADRKTAGATGKTASAGEMAHRLADTMEGAARYLRDNDARALGETMERQLRENPLQTLLTAVAAGWLVGKIVR